MTLPFVEWSEQVLEIGWTPYQRAVCHVLGGGDPTTEIEREIWGFDGPVERGLRRVIALRLGRYSGKTTIAAAYGLWSVMTCDLSEAGKGAKAICPIVAPNAESSQLVFSMALEMASAAPLLKDCINKKGHDEARRTYAVTTTSLFLMRPHDGRQVEIRATVATAGGSKLVGYDIPAGVIDEAERVRSESEKGITDKSQVDAMMPRVLPGRSVLMISTPYDFDSYMHKHVEANWGHPKTGLAAIGGSRKMRPDSQTVLDRIADEMMRDPLIAQRDYDCIPLGREDSYFKASDVDACTLDGPPMYRECVTGGTDLGFITDGSGGLTLARQDATLWQTWEYLALPRDGKRLLPSIVRMTIGDGLLAAGANLVAADVHEYASLCEDLIPRGIQVAQAPTGVALGSAFGLVRELIRAGRLRVLPTTAAQLKKVRMKPSGEPRVDRSKDGHCDLVSALVAAVWLDRRHGPLVGGHDARPAAMRGGWTH